VLLVIYISNVIQSVIRGWPMVNYIDLLKYFIGWYSFNASKSISL
jgi:hypothetical protein